MAKRPAGIGAFMHAFENYELDRRALESRLLRAGSPRRPIFGEIAKRLALVFSDFEVEVSRSATTSTPLIASSLTDLLERMASR